MITLEPYQQRAVEWLAKTKRGIVVAPAGSGKTILIAAALDNVMSLKQRTAVVRVGWCCMTIEQKQQALDALSNFPRLENNAEVRVECAAAETNWSDCNLLIVDEVHHAPAETWARQIETCPGARWGMTATPFSEDDERNKLLLSLFDNRVFTIDRDEVSARLVPAKVTLLNATDPDLQAPMDAEIDRLIQRRQRWWKGEAWELRAQASWYVCIKRGIVDNTARNAAAVAAAIRHSNDSVLVLVNEIEHGKLLAKTIPGAEVCYSQMGKAERKSVLDRFKSGELKCVVATSLADEGADFPRCNVLILVSGGRNESKTVQRTGRVLRAFPGKTHGQIFDFVDTFHPMMERHAKKRIATYRKLGYEIEHH